MAKDKKECKISILKDGPYIVSGGVPLSEKIITPKGNTYEYKEGRSLPQAETYALCRCGHTKTPPFCDGRHKECKFDGTETASNSDFMDRIDLRIQGLELDLLDDGRCAFARFCHREDGDLWTLAESSNPEHVEDVIKGTRECPAGRLEVKDKEGNTIEEEFEVAIEVLQDPEKGVSGPLYVKGNIEIQSSNGDTYEKRNRVTLCRCGESRNKPFCDAMHVSTGYLDK